MSSENPDHDVVIRLDEVLGERGMTLTELSQQIGIAVVNLSILKTGKARAVRFSTLSALCHALDCKPGDLLDINLPDDLRGKT